MAFADLSDIFPIQSLLYFQRSPVTRHRRASHMLCKLHYTLPSQREFGPPVLEPGLPERPIKRIGTREAIPNNLSVKSQIYEQNTHTHTETGAENSLFQF